MASTKKSPKYKTKVTQVRNFPGAKETTVKIYRPSKSLYIDVWEMKNILTNMQKLRPNAQFMVRAMNNAQMFTFKGYDDEELKIEEFEDYYENKVRDSDKFKKFSHIEITAYDKLSPDAKSKGKKR